MYELYNAGDQPVCFSVDTRPLEELRKVRTPLSTLQVFSQASGMCCFDSLIGLSITTCWTSWNVWNQKESCLLEHILQFPSSSPLGKPRPILWVSTERIVHWSSSLCVHDVSGWPSNNVLQWRECSGDIQRRGFGDSEGWWGTVWGDLFTCHHSSVLSHSSP